MPNALTRRALLAALSEPGTLQQVAGEITPPEGLATATATALLTLVDYETPVWLPEALRNGPAGAWLRFHCGAALVDDPAEAAFAVIDGEADEPKLSAFNLGTDQFPDRSTTLIVQVTALKGGSALALSGPGILGSRNITPQSLRTGFIVDSVAEDLLAHPGVGRRGGDGYPLRWTQLLGQIIDPFLAALQSDDYSRTIGDYWRTLLTGSGQVVIERVMKDLYATSPHVVALTFRSSLLFNPVSMLRRYPGPKLSVISHLNDAPYSLHNLVSDLPFIKMSGTGHWLQMDRPEKFNQILDQFLADLEGEEESPGGGER